MTACYNPFTLEGKSILITGASSGIGRSIAVECSRMGASLILIGRNESRLKETISLLNPGNHNYYVCDITDDSQVEVLYKELIAIDGIVHSAGIGLTLPFKFTSKEKLESLMHVNFEAPVLLTQGLLKRKLIKTI